MRIVVCGGGVVGLAVGMMLADDGHAVTILEADPSEVPESATAAWENWERKGVAQFRQPHNFFPRVTQILEAELPGLVDRLAGAGCVWWDLLETLPPPIADSGRREGDERFVGITGRRPVVEMVFGQAARDHADLEVRRGVRVAGLLAADVPGLPLVTGVRTAEGEDLGADLVIDATGRRTKSADWLAGIGATPPVTEAEDIGFVYYTRYFTGPEVPRRKAPGLSPMGSFSILTLPGDNGTWSVTLYTASGDAPLKAFRETEVFTAVARACPLHAHWLDGEPVTDVLAMAGIVDTYRRFLVDGAPVVAGYLAVGDAWACTNPSAGRGISVGLVHAQELRAVLRQSAADLADLSVAWDEATEAVVTPFYRAQIAADRFRAAEMDSLREGREPPAPEGPFARLLRGAPYDPVLFRTLIETVSCLAVPHEVLARPDVTARLDALPPVDPVRLPGPDRQRLLELVS